MKSLDDLLLSPSVPLNSANTTGRIGHVPSATEEDIVSIAKANGIALKPAAAVPVSEPVPSFIALPVDDKSRKALPIFDGCIMYFPDALLAVSEVSRIGNEQHNPGEPLHWDRNKSMDQYNTALRHMIDHRKGAIYDVDGGRHLAKAAWRVLAALQLDIEKERLAHAPVRSNHA